MALAKFAAQAAMAGFFVATAMLYRYTPYCSGVVCVGGGGGSGSAPGGGGGSNTPDVPSDDSRGFFTIAAITAAEDDDEVVEVSSNWNDKSKVSQLILDRRLYHKTIYIIRHKTFHRMRVAGPETSRESRDQDWNTVQLRL